MSAVLYWFRHDLRLGDNPALCQALAQADSLLPVVCLDDSWQPHSPWPFARLSPARQRVRADALAALDAALQARGSRLLVLHGAPQQVLPPLLARHGLQHIVAEDIAAPEEQAQVAALRQAGLRVDTVWQSTLLDPASLPFAPAALPASFTAFRQRVEAAAVRPPAPLAAPAQLPPPPAGVDWQPLPHATAEPDPRSSLPWHQPAAHAGEAAGLAHLQQYLARDLPRSYKATRNGLIGLDYSSKWSLWLALGSVSARTLYAALQGYEAQHGTSDGSYWLWFELLWRDYFRLLHRQYGARLYRGGGLHGQPPAPMAAEAFARWCEGRTGHAFIDAGMRELAATGYLSNRLRQNVASYLIHDLRGDWRAGAAWFEAQLVDYDVYSNQGNWLYLAGRGTDPRGSRRFNPDKQAADYDADGAYRRLWGTR